MPQHPVEVECAAELGGGEREHHLLQRPPGQQVDAGRLQLAGTRSEQREPQAARLDEAMDFVEQGRQPLHLVDDHPVARRLMADGLSEEGRVREQILVQPFVEQIDERRIRKRLARPRALADAAHAEQEEALSGRRGQAAVGGHHDVKNT